MKSEQTFAMITGRPAVFTWGGIIKPSFFGRTTLQIKGARLIETTRHLTTRYQRDVLLTEVEGGELVNRPHSLLFAIGIATIILLGLGFFFIALSYVYHEHYMLILARNRRIAVTIKGDEKPYRQFLDSVLGLAAQARKIASLGAGNF